ncbi:MAG: hypothetical protein ABIB97_00480 [Patescibacteria group bacterium]
MSIASLANTEQPFRINDLKNGGTWEGKPEAVELVKEGAILTMVNDQDGSVRFLMDYQGRLYREKDGRFDVNEDTWYIKSQVWVQVDRAPIRAWIELQERVQFHRCFETW